MKVCSAAMFAHINSEVTTLATLWRVTRKDGVVFRFTDHQFNLAYMGDTYIARCGYTRTAIKHTGDLAVNNLDLETVFDSAGITEVELRAGKFDFAKIDVFVVNYKDISMGAISIQSGTLGEITIQDNTYRAELRGLTQPYVQAIGEVTAPLCRADFGDTRCGFTPRVHHGCTITGVDSQWQFYTNLDSPYTLTNGLLIFTSGPNTGKAIEVRNYKNGNLKGQIIQVDVGNVDSNGNLLGSSAPGYSNHNYGMGNGYGPNPKVTVIDPLGTGKGAVMVLDVQAFESGTQGVVDYEVVQVLILRGGAGYSTKTYLKIQDTGDAAILTPKLVDDGYGGLSVDSVQIKYGGTNYQNPVIVVYDPYAVVQEAAQFTVTMGPGKDANGDPCVGQITNVKVLDTNQTVTVDPGSGQTQVTGTIHGGRGYTADAQLHVIDETAGHGSGAVLTPRMATYPGTPFVQLFMPAPFTLHVGDTFDIYEGCNHTIAQCATKGPTTTTPPGNVVNFRAEPHLPGNDAVMQVPDAPPDPPDQPPPTVSSGTVTQVKTIKQETIGG